MARKSGFDGAQAQFFNGLHLRLEADAFRWIEMVGGAEMLWNYYFDACAAAGLNATAPVYVASGIFTSMTPFNRHKVRRLATRYSNRCVIGAQSDELGRARPTVARV
jgi:hypothetical protein